MAYQWTQTLWNTDGNMVTNTNFSNPVHFMLQVQVCRNITKPIMPEVCNVSAPAYMVRMHLQYLSCMYCNDQNIVCIQLLVVSC